MSKKDVQAGGAFVRVFLKSGAVNKGLTKLRKRLRSFGQSATAVGARLFALGAAGVAAFAPAIQAASNLEEVMNKFNVVFGNNAGDVKAWGDNFADQVGRSKRQIAEFLGEAQDLFVPIGFDEKSATKLSKDITGLAVDLASFNNKADADVLIDLKAALTGSGEVMKKYGVILSQAAVKQELLNDGIKIKDATEQQKVMARSAIIMRGTTAAQGDATRSAGSWANQLKRLKGKTEDAAASIGGVLLPIITPLITKAANAITLFSEWAEENKPLIATIFKVAAGMLAAGAAIFAMGGVAIFLGSALGGVMAIASAVGAVIGALISPIGAIVAAVGSATFAFFKWTAAGKSTMTAGKEVFATLKADALAAFGGIKDAMAAGNFQLAAAILWAAINMEWAKGTEGLKGKWIEFKELFSTGFGMLKRSVLTSWTALAGGVRDIWAAVADIVKASFLSTIKFVLSQVKAATKLLNKIDPTSVTGKALKGMDMMTAGIDAEIAKGGSAGGVMAATRKADDDLKAKLDSEDEARVRRFQKERIGLVDSVAAAKKEFTDLLKQAAGERKAATKKKKTKKEVVDAVGGSGGVAAVASTTANTITRLMSGEGLAAIAGVFRGASGTDPATMTATNTKKTAVATEAIAKNTKALPKAAAPPAG